MLRITLAPLAILILVFLTSSSFAGKGYEITSFDGKKEITYKVKFGGGKLFQQLTAYDPVSKKFAYLRWRRKGVAPAIVLEGLMDEPPAAVGMIWDHETGETKKLYKFPGVKHPLTVIPSLSDMKVCPLTGDRNYKVGKQVMFYD